MSPEQVSGLGLEHDTVQLTREAIRSIPNIMSAVNAVLFTAQVDRERGNAMREAVMEFLFLCTPELNQGKHKFLVL